MMSLKTATTNFFRQVSARRELFALGLFVCFILVAASLKTTPKLPTGQPKKLSSALTAVNKAPITDNHISIAKLSVSAPLFIDIVGTDETKYFKALEHGVAHYRGTSLPGQTGNTFIFGHSAFDETLPGEYKRVFEHLDELAIDDPIEIKTSNDRFMYKVISSKIVDDDDVSVLSQETGDRQLLTLMTCWPPGTLEKRYIVQALLQ